MDKNKEKTDVYHIKLFAKYLTRFYLNKEEEKNAVAKRIENSKDEVCLWC